MEPLLEFGNSFKHSKHAFAQTENEKFFDSPGGGHTMDSQKPRRKKGGGRKNEQKNATFGKNENDKKTTKKNMFGWGKNICPLQRWPALITAGETNANLFGFANLTPNHFRNLFKKILKKKRKKTISLPNWDSGHPNQKALQ